MAYVKLVSINKFVCSGFMKSKDHSSSLISFLLFKTGLPMKLTHAQLRTQLLTVACPSFVVKFAYIKKNSFSPLIFASNRTERGKCIKCFLCV